MSRLATSFVLGYHGCDEDVGRKAIDGDIAIIQSDRDYDWLGPGAYFWEADPQRAMEWARLRVRRGAYKNPFVIGAVIDLGNSLDLVSREDQDILRAAYTSFAEMRSQAGLPMPKNETIGDHDKDRRLRYLDCAVIRHLHQVVERQDRPSYDTVRGMFTEGPELYPGSGFHGQSHVQVAVRNADCIKGLFRPVPYPA